MKTVSPDSATPRVLLFGVRCRFSNVVQEQLVAHGLAPVALILPGPPGIAAPIRVHQRPSLLPMAGTSTQPTTSTPPIYQFGDLRSEASINVVRSLSPDIIVVACFTRLIPATLRDVARFGAVNIHPSLLPAHRGPDPLFWIMRDGGEGCGVTVHAVSDRFDAGDILAQQAVPYPDGAREPEIETTLATVGGNLAVDVIRNLAAGRQERIPQDNRLATYETWPDEADYQLDTGWDLRRAWNFVRGVANHGIPIRVDGPDGSLFIADAIDFGLSGDAPEPVECQTVIRFARGWMLARRAVFG